MQFNQKASEATVPVVKGVAIKAYLTPANEQRTSFVLRKDLRALEVGKPRKLGPNNQLRKKWTPSLQRKDQETLKRQVEAMEKQKEARKNVSKRIRQLKEKIGQNQGNEHCDDLDLILDLCTAESRSNDLSDSPSQVRYLDAQGEMDPRDTSEAGSQIVEKDSTNVDLVENRGDTTADPLVATIISPRILGFTHPPAVFPDLTDRWNNVGTISWDVTQGGGTIIHKLNLPRDIIPLLTSNPALLPLGQYLYWEPQIEVRFQLNSTRFHQGMLLCAFKYYATIDSDQAGRVPQSAHQLWQLDYASLNAASSNIAEIRVPFQSHLDMLPIRQGAIGSSSYYATVYLGVVANLQVGEGGSNTVTITQQVRLSCGGIPTRFFGQRNYRTLTAQGITSYVSGTLSNIGVLANTASKVSKAILGPIEGLFTGFGSLFKASNQDKPIVPLESDLLIVNPTVSLSHGAGPTHAKIMRLTPTMLTPHHPETVPSSGDCLSNGIARKWGYVSYFTISVNDTPGRRIIDLPITPVYDYAVGTGKNLPTPCSGIAAMYTYWSGTIEFKFVVVKADPHSLRLRFSAHPSDNDADGRNLISTIQDFQEITEVTYRAPYFGPTKMLPTFYNGNAVAAGVVRVELESALITMNSIANSVTVLVLQRGGEDLEFAVPRAIMYYPISTNDTKVTWTILFLGKFSNTTEFQKYKFDFPLIEAGKWSGTHVNNTVSVQQDLSNSGERVLRCLNSDVSPIPRIGSGVQSGLYIPYTWTINSATVNVRRYETLSEQYWFCEIPITGFTARITVHYPTPDAIVTMVAPKVHKPQRRLQPQGIEPMVPNEREDIGNEQGPVVIPAPMARTLLGEEFDLKTSLRRYQPVLWGTLNADVTGVYQLLYDVNFGSLHTRRTEERTDNLSWCHDAFRFAKGSLNYNFIIDYASEDSYQVNVVHLPGGIESDVIVNTDFQLITASELTELGMFAHDIVGRRGTAVPFSVPYYNYTKYLINGYDPTVVGIGSRAAYAMGRICIYVKAAAQSIFSWRLERSLGDDADLYTFQGWPLCGNTFTATRVQVNSDEPLKTSNNRVKGEEDQPRRVLKLLDPQMRLAEAQTTLTNCRRDQQRLKKAVKFLQPQFDEDQVILSQTQVVQMIQAQEALARVYADGKRLQTVMPEFVMSMFDSEFLMDLLSHDVTGEELFIRRANIVAVVNKCYYYYTNCPSNFYRLAKIPHVKSSAFGGALNGVSEVAGNLVDKFKSLVKSVGNSMENSNFLSLVVFKRLVAGSFTIFKDPKHLFTLISDVHKLLCASDLWVKAYAFVGLLSLFGVINTSATLLLTPICVLFGLTSQRVNKGYIYLYPQGTEIEQKKKEAITSYCAALMGGIAGLCGFKTAKTWTAGVEAFAKNVGSVTNSWQKLLTDSCSFIVDYVLYLLGYELPQLGVLQNLKGCQMDVQKWADEVGDLIKPSNRNLVVSSPKHRKRVAELYEEGNSLVRLLMLDKSYPVQGQYFLSMWRQLGELFAETGEVPSSINANMTPVTIWVHGAPGTGKSEMCKTMAAELALGLGESFDGEPFFIRTPRRYWDGYTHQPIVIFDDALQVRSPDIHSSFITDWFGLNTNQPYSPEFASVTEKKKFVRPKLIIVNSNIATPTDVPGVASVEAFSRRRDFLIRASFSKWFLERYPGIVNCNDHRVDDKDFENFKHLEFAIHDDVIGQQEPRGALTYNELVVFLIKRAQKLRERRRKTAENQIRAGEMLHPEHFEETRNALMERLNIGEVAVGAIAPLVENVTSLVGTTLAQVDPQGKNIKVFKADLSGNWDGICMSDCESLPLKCFCEISPEEELGLRVSPRCCIECREWILYEKQEPFWVPVSRVGFCLDCDSRKDEILTRICTYNDNRLSKDPLSLTIPRPVVRKVVVKKDRRSFAELSTWVASKVTSIWDQIPWHYVVPLGVSLVALYFVRALGILEKIGDLIGGVSGERKGFNWKTSAAPNLATSGDVKTAKYVPRRLGLRPQSEVDALIPRIKRNFVRMHICFESGKVSAIDGIGFTGRKALFPFHGFVSKDNIIGIDVQLSGLDGKEAGVVELKPEDIIVERIGDIDLCVVNFVTRRIPNFRKLYKSVVGEKSFAAISRSFVYVSAKDRSIERIEAQPCFDTIAYNNSDIVYECHGFDYQRTSGPGECGSLLVDSRTGLIVGMHVAGTDRVGFAIRFCREELEGHDEDDLDVEEPLLEAGGLVEPMGEFIPIGKVRQPQAVDLPLSTQIVESSCPGILGPKVRKPVKMIEPGEPVSGVTKLTRGVNKMTEPTRTWPIDVMERVYEWRLEKTLSMKPVTNDVKVRSLEEGIVGLKECEFFEPLKRNTSVGWPLSQLGIGSTKEKFVKYEVTAGGLQVLGLRPEFKTMYENELAKREQGIIPFSVYSVFMKDERLKEGKDPRLIQGCSFVYAVLFRQYFGDFFAAYVANGKQLGHSIGINVHGPAWSELARRLLSKGDRIVCGDYTGFGPGLDPELVIAFVDRINAWYRMYQTVGRDNLDIQCRVRRTLFEGNAFSYNILRDTIIQTLCGSPSGNPATAPINSEINMTMIGCAWLTVMGETVLGDLVHFERMCECTTYGDDLIMSVNPLILDQWNNEALQQAFAEVGVKYTDADKTGTIRRSCDILEASFLKCEFIPHPTRGRGFYLAGLDKRMIEDIPNWVRKPYTSHDEVSLANCVEACHLAYGHGKAYFYDVVSRVRSYWRERNVTPQIHSWEYLDQLYFGELKGVSLPKEFDPTNYQWA